MSRRAARADANQGEIVEALRAVGCSVQPLHMVGRGCPDLAVGKGGVTYWIEIKDGSKPPSERRLTEDQLKWHGAWRGGPVAVVCDVESALRVVRVGQVMPAQIPNEHGHLLTTQALWDMYVEDGEPAERKP